MLKILMMIIIIIIIIVVIIMVITIIYDQAIEQMLNLYDDDSEGDYPRFVQFLLKAAQGKHANQK